ncbi:T9SS type A sorting domain-containing protein [Maribacter sp. 2210JD10-5]|uniref:T9SS type A sorting domain-containing protein n=1 Tax=Maribacter sp. 2210JD10-5 TaxID=3386272 RepID=UPI0039BC605A
MKISVYITLLISLGVHSQTSLRQTLSISGGLSKANIGPKRYVLFQSVGQSSVINTFGVTDKTLRQGFVQPLGPAAIEDVNLQLSLIFYPNPFVNSINVDFEEEPVEEVSVFMFDMLGRLVLSKEYGLSKSFNVNTATISTGGYLLTIQSGERKNVQQVIKF